VHTIHEEAHILLTHERVSHINLTELTPTKIPALAGRASITNLLILETIATEGPLLKYDVHKRLKERGIVEYSTITRRIDSLKEKGYLGEAGKRVTERGKQKAESLYGLTWKGFFASFTSQKTKQDILQVIEKNPLLVIPEKEFVLLVLREVFDSKEIEKITELLLYGCMKTISNLENIREEDLWLWVLQGIREIPTGSLKIGAVPEKKKDLLKLLDNPRILQYLKTRIIPIISEWERNLRVFLQIFEVLNQIGNFIKKLSPEDEPSERLKKYLKTKKFEERLIKITSTQN
jgi:DNA-binding MarR family transcriptional regulator/transposase